MAGNKDKIIDELFRYANSVISRHHIYPYVDLIVKDNVIISRGYNQERETQDITRQSQVVAVREAQDALETGNLSGYTLHSFFEPTILSFDVALWAGIRDFIWCVNKASVPSEYNQLNYGPLDYQEKYPHKIRVTSGVREKEALELVKLAQSKNYYSTYLLETRRFI